GWSIGSCNPCFTNEWQGINSTAQPFIYAEMQMWAGGNRVAGITDGAQHLPSGHFIAGCYGNRIEMGVIKRALIALNPYMLSTPRSLPYTRNTPFRSSCYRGTARGKNIDSFMTPRTSIAARAKKT